jgi:AraC-like DNA-binding protein
MVYGYYGRRNIKIYHQWVKDNYSHYHRYNFSWLSRLSSIFLYFLTVWFGYFIVDYFLFNYALSISDYYPFHLILAIISIWLSIEAYSKPDILYPDETVKKSTSENKSVDIDEDLQTKAAWLREQVELNLLYLDPELSLRSLADTLDIHPNFASKIINEGLNQTFSDCINEYRVKAVVKKLQDPQHDNATFLAIAFDCGFNSKTSFNRIFKKKMGLTPLQFKNNLQKS